MGQISDLSEKGLAEARALVKEHYLPKECNLIGSHPRAYSAANHLHGIIEVRNEIVACLGSFLSIVGKTIDERQSWLARKSEERGESDWLAMASLKMGIFEYYSFWNYVAAYLFEIYELPEKNENGKQLKNQNLQKIIDELRMRESRQEFKARLETIFDVFQSERQKKIVERREELTHRKVMPIVPLTEWDYYHKVEEGLWAHVATPQWNPFYLFDLICAGVSDIVEVQKFLAAMHDSWKWPDSEFTVQLPFGTVSTSPISKWDSKESGMA